MRAQPYGTRATRESSADARDARDDAMRVVTRAMDGEKYLTSMTRVRRATDARVMGVDRRGVMTGTSLLIFSSAWRASSARASAAGDLTRRGMAKFSGFDVRGSVEAFDGAIAVDPAYAGYMWQRGLALYALGDYAGAAAQFRVDVGVNPNDTEEAVWCFASEAMDPAKGVAYARENMLRTGRDARPVMSSVRELFASGTEEAEAALKEAGKRSAGDEFYALLYLGLFHEINGENARAKEDYERANRTVYAKLSGDYMADVSRVLERR